MADVRTGNTCPAVVIGVSGHRILADVERVTAGIDVALRRIESAFPGASWIVASALAEGADRLVVERILRRENSRLSVVLPVAAGDYETDFKAPESRDQFRLLLACAERVVELEPYPQRATSYEAAGLWVLDRSDVLILIWDGRIEQGRGGTGEIASRARERGTPIAWVHAGNRRPGTLEPSSLGDEQGVVTFENFPLA